MSAVTQSTTSYGTRRPSAATLALKRLLDVAGSSLGLIALWPFFIIIAIGIRLDTPGPVFFRQERVGRGGKLFPILKFRSMVCDAPHIGRVITIRADSRITRVGSFIRKIKLDEFPQLIDVLIGDMSLVGPRPEVPELMTLYTQEQQALILSFRPGMTDYASILCDIMPIKFSYYERYSRDVGFINDVRIICATVALLMVRHVPKIFGIEHALPLTKPE